MKKAVLLLDSVPNDCVECDLGVMPEFGELYCAAIGEDGDWHERPSWCPLISVDSKEIKSIERKRTRYKSLHEILTELGKFLDEDDSSEEEDEKDS